MAAKTRKEQLEELLAEDPADPFLRYGLAMEHVSAGNDDEAVRCFRQLFLATPDYVPGYMQCGQALVRLGRIDEAREIYRTGITTAQTKGDQHASEEMQGMLEGIE
jgi:Flp pilus assembly protein TadD